ncbi:succinate-semialdehyde dehydrogenase [Sphingomonas sp. Leaf407]|uniref:NAD-dependent succinate-semialdehyde dehydrogenase n=1 Tax=unclassified Sphingomonas TaxID=196159 RepID=UPI0006F8A85F|nr:MULTISPECIES: NAD-dependent succinate-semialdehyde dehydrogenase [unclassified Sphingomonas]KQN33783.1 succinate-semialdehyde dehydrogenase [Sphingomonas sp. Leaf42]KQT25064.1 succinate-semialdehyde dehydrogenase [Sphingomonas sp. Leaf407]
MFKSVNPATGQQIATYPRLGADEIEAKLARAARAYAAWRLTPLAERVALLERIAEQYDANKDRLARMATAEMGKTLASAVAEVGKCAAAFRHYATHGPAMLEPQHFPLGDAGSAEVRFCPQGPVLAIMPWNFPYWQAVRFLAPTILAGNVALLKHASIVQGAAGLMEEMALAAGAPEGLFQNLAIGSDAVAELIADPRVVAVTLTGSEGAGIAVAEAAGRNLKKVVLELGGSDPFIVMPSADLDKAVKAAVQGRIQNSGQSCICAKRMIVHADVYDAFLDRFAAAMRAAKVGDPLDPEVVMGPLSSFEQRDTVVGQIEEAKRQGATLLFGGEQPDLPGAYLTPGILTNVPPDGPLMAEEIFGPIAMLFRATHIDEAITLANAIPFGLGSSVWTADRQEEERFVRDIEAGMVAVNHMLASSPQAPFGGIKRSGHGRELGPFGLHEFMNLKTVFHAKGAGGEGAKVE